MVHQWWLTHQREYFSVVIVFCHWFRVMASLGEPLLLIHNSWARSICIKFAKLRLGFMRCFFGCYKRHARFRDWCNDSMQQQLILSNPIGVGFGGTEWLKLSHPSQRSSKGMAQSHQQSKAHQVITMKSCEWNWERHDGKWMGFSGV